jgi:hypothetical protein
MVDLADAEGLIIVPDADPLTIFNLLDAGHTLQLLLGVRPLGELDFAVERMRFYITKGSRQ